MSCRIATAYEEKVCKFVDDHFDADEDDDLIMLFLQRALDPVIRKKKRTRDGLLAHKRYAVLQLESATLWDEQCVLWNEYRDKIDDAARSMSQYVLIANSNGNPLRPSELSAQQVQRYTVQLLALRHVYE